jgi:tetratricopeptide (TPR) repeat protein
VFFVTAACLEIGWFKFNEAEVAEVLVGTALVLMLLHYLVVDLGTPATSGVPEPAAAQSVRCGQLYVGVFAVLIALAYLTTSWFYNLPGRAAGIDARLARGFDKFGGRMQQAERWQVAADLYLNGFALGPQNLPMLHKALAVFQAQGDAASYQKYYRIMLDTTARQLMANDASVENQLMLAANYAEIEDQTAAREYLARALATATQWVAASPDESEAYYWLGRAHQQRGDYAEARRAYETAKTMEPGRSRYILALRSLNKI